MGGHCIAVDPWFIVSSAPATARLIRTAREVNDAKPRWVIDQVRRAADGLATPVIAVLGLAFKPDIDDLRESPALAIATELASTLSGATILAVEPHIDVLPDALLAAGAAAADAEDAIARADIVLLLVDHKQFAALDQGLLAGKVVLDTRGLWHERAPQPAAGGSVGSPLGASVGAEVVGDGSSVGSVGGGLTGGSLGSSGTGEPVGSAVLGGAVEGSGSCRGSSGGVAGGGRRRARGRLRGRRGRRLRAGRGRGEGHREDGGRGARHHRGVGEFGVGQHVRRVAERDAAARHGQAHHQRGGAQRLHLLLAADPPPDPGGEGGQPAGEQREPGAADEGRHHEIHQQERRHEPAVAHAITKPQRSVPSPTADVTATAPGPGYYPA